MPESPHAQKEAPMAVPYKKLGTGAGEEETQEPWSATCHRHPDDGPEEEKGLVLFKFKMKEVGSTERILSERVRGLLT